MAPNKKKKKPASNPARGFATVSIPSKPKTNNEVLHPEEITISALPDSQDRTFHEGPTTADGAPGLRDLSPEQLEKYLVDAELQSLVDKCGARSKRESLRQATKLETERRLLRPQAIYLHLSQWLPFEIMEQILEFAKEERKIAELTTESDCDSTGVDLLEEDLCVRLWTLQQTLQRLGFGQLRVEQALWNVLTRSWSYGSHSGAGTKDTLWGLEESLLWFAMHCDPMELPEYEGKNKGLQQKRFDPDSSNPTSQAGKTLCTA